MSIDKISCLFVGSSLPHSRVQLVTYLALSPAFLSSSEFTYEQLSTWIYSDTKDPDSGSNHWQIYLVRN